MTKGEFELFCQRHRNGMYFVAHSVLFDAQNAEDAVQIAALRILKIFQTLTFGTDQEERVYALRAARSAAIDVQRRNSKQTRGIDDDADMELVPSCDTTVDGANARALQLAMDRIIEKLPERQRTVLRYRLMGLNYEEISTTLGIDIANARTAAHRARLAVARALREEGFEVE